MSTSAKKGNEKASKTSLIDIRNVVGGVIIFIGVAVLLVAMGLFFFSLLVLIEYFLTKRRTTGSMSVSADLAATLARKRNKGWLGSSIGGIPLGEGIVELRKRIMSVHMKAHVSLDGLNVPAVFIHLKSYGLAHAKGAMKGPLHE